MGPTYLVTAAAGSTGMATVRDLLGRGEAVRAMVRADDARASLLRSAGAEVVVGSLTDMAAVRTALAGVQRAYFVAPFMPTALDAAMGFAAAAEEARLELVVSLSQWLADPLHPSAHTRRAWLADAAFSWMPSVGHITVNPGFFADNYMAALDTIVQLGLLAMPLGQGRNAPPSNEDIAAVVGALLVSPDHHIGRSYRPTGPELLTPEGIADAFARAIGRPVGYRDVPFWMLAKVARSIGYADFDVAQLRWYTEEYRRDTFAIDAPTDAVPVLAGRPAEPFETTVSRYLAEPGATRRTTARQARALASMTAAMAHRAGSERAYRERYVDPQEPGALLAVDSPGWLATHAVVSADAR